MRDLIAPASLILSLIVPQVVDGRDVCVQKMGNTCLRYEKKHDISPARQAERHLNLTRSDWRNIQSALKATEHYNGAIDGLVGPGTRNAIRKWQRENGLKSSGFVNDNSFGMLKFVNRQNSNTLSTQDNDIVNDDIFINGNFDIVLSGPYGICNVSSGVTNFQFSINNVLNKDARHVFETSIGKILLELSSLSGSKYLITFDGHKFGTTNKKTSVQIDDLNNLDEIISYNVFKISSDPELLNCPGADIYLNFR